VENALNTLRFLLLAVGFLTWVVGGNVVLAGARKRLGWRRLTIPPWSKFTRAEVIKLLSFIVIFAACFFAFVQLGSM